MFEERIEKAVEFFKSGYNCSQSVVLAFADMYGFTQEQAARMAASFGGGIGRMEMVRSRYGGGTEIARKCYGDSTEIMPCKYHKKDT